MPEKNFVLIVTGNEKLAADLQAKILPIADAKKVNSNFMEAYSIIKEQQPPFLLIDIDTDEETGFALAQRVVRVLSDTLVFIVSCRKEPELILRAIKIGVSDYLVVPYEGKTIVSALQLALQRKQKKYKEGELVVLFSNKGGMGVTTLAVNVTDHIQLLTEARVTLVDLNLYGGDLSVFLGIKPTYTLMDLASDLNRLDDNLLFSSLVRHPRRFYVIPAQEEISEAKLLTERDIIQIFQALKKHMDYILVDVSHNFSERTAATMDIADKILVVTQQNVAAINHTKRLLGLFRDIGYSPLDKVKVIINRYQAQSKFTPKIIEEVLGEKIYAYIANDYLPVEKAISEAKLIDEVGKNSAINKDMAMLVSRITGVKKEFARGGKKLFPKTFTWPIFKRAIRMKNK